MDNEQAKFIQRAYQIVRYVLLAAILVALGVAKANAEGTDDFGMWATIEVQKGLGQRWTVGGALEQRTKNDNMDIDRWQVALNGSYKLSKYFKLGAVYELHMKRYPSKSSGQALVNDDAVCGIRHRGMADITGTVKVGSWLKLSLRERYEYTHLMARSGISSSNEQEWRSRLKAEMDKKDVKWAPFISAEIFDNLQDHFRLDEMRLAAGTVYKFNSHHSINLGYLLDRKWSTSGSTSNIHVITSGYTYKF